MCGFEFDETKEAVINPSNVIDEVSSIPEVAVACFSKDLFEKIVEGAKCMPIAYITNTNGKKTIYEIEIIDYGKGIENIEMAKQPLYTSNPDMERSGMGFTIMENFMDDMKVESIVGMGTKVYMKKVIKEAL